jgi:hypothetical protein
MKKYLSLIVLGLWVAGQAPRSGAQEMTAVTSAVAIPVAPVIAPKAPLLPSGVAEIVRAKYPLAVTYQDFGAGWREFDWNYGKYFTKGDTHWLQETEYLVTYRFAPREARRLDEKDYLARATNNAAPFAADDRFELTLLPTSGLIPYITNGNTGLRSFDPSRYRTPFDAGKTTTAFNQNLSLTYLHKIFEAFSAYGNAYLQTTPPMHTAFAARQALLPFAENSAIFTQPGTDQPYKANPNFSGRKRAHLRNKSRAVIFYEGETAEDGMRAVLQFNGNVRRVDEKQWRELKKLSGLE